MILGAARSEAKLAGNGTENIGGGSLTDGSSSFSSRPIGSHGQGQNKLSSLARSFGFVAAASVTGQFIGFVVLAIVARRVGPANLGAYSFAANFAPYLYFPVNFGITMLAVRDVSQAPASAPATIGEVAIIRLVLFCVCFLLPFIFGPGMAPTRQAWSLLIVVGVGVFVDVFTLGWVLQALQRFGLVGLSTLAGQIVYGVLAPLLVSRGSQGVTWYAWMNILGAAVTATACAFAVIRLVGLPDVRVTAHNLWRRIKRSAPLGMSLVMIQIYYSLDSVMLGYMRPIADVGQYGVAYKIVFAVIGLGSLWASVIYPHAARMFVAEPERLGQQVSRAAAVSGTLAVPLAVGGTLVAVPLMTTLFGSAYQPAGAPFAVLIWSAAIVLVSVNFGNVLLGCGGEHEFAIGVSVGAACNVLLNVLLIPHFGTVGAAVATVSAEALVAVYMAARLRRRIPLHRPNISLMVRASAMALIMAVCVFALRHSVPIWLTIVIGAVTYAFAGVLLGVLRRQDVAALLGRTSKPGSE